MIKNNRVILFFALLALAIGLMGCGGAQTTTDNKGTNTTASNTKPADNKAETKPVENKTEANKPADKTEANKTEANKTETKTETAGADKIGVAECDKFIENYEACLFEKVPEAQRTAFKPGLDQWKKSWKDLAANPSTKGTLAQACKTAAETAKTSMSSFSCKWD